MIDKATLIKHLKDAIEALETYGDLLYEEGESNVVYDFVGYLAEGIGSRHKPVSY
jgi:hypothetical protein